MENCGSKAIEWFPITAPITTPPGDETPATRTQKHPKLGERERETVKKRIVKRTTSSIKNKSCRQRESEKERTNRNKNNYRTDRCPRDNRPIQDSERRENITNPTYMVPTTIHFSRRSFNLLHPPSTIQRQNLPQQIAKKQYKKRRDEYICPNWGKRKFQNKRQ
eukprot:Lithocolla_globosa_v1_NODE_177_length_5446_cov_18.556483.p3 type:complete len:164 gc:universal NODE_177_length_5446_cov_18.556483:3140-3631(+)